LTFKIIPVDRTRNCTMLKTRILGLRDLQS